MISTTKSDNITNKDNKLLLKKLKVINFLMTRMIWLTLTENCNGEWANGLVACQISEGVRNRGGSNGKEVTTIGSSDQWWYIARVVCGGGDGPFHNNCRRIVW